MLRDQFRILALEKNVADLTETLGQILSVIPQDEIAIELAAKNRLAKSTPTRETLRLWANDAPSSKTVESAEEECEW
jgi:hypothetical protein